MEERLDMAYVPISHIRTLAPIVIAATFFVHSLCYGSSTKAQFKLIAEEAEERTYLGQATIQAVYEILENGDLCLLLNKSQATSIPLAHGSIRICFTNQEEALLMLNLEEKIKNIDLKNICGFNGTFSANIKDLKVGEGPASRWFTTRLKSASHVSTPRKIACHS